MKYPLEEKLPYMWLALAVLAIFYGIYFSKMLVQKRHGIRTHQIGRRKEKTLHTIEMLMGIATLGAPAAQLLSIALGWSCLPANARFTGFCIGMLGDLIFLALRSVHEGQLAGGDPRQGQDRAGHHRHLPLQPQPGLSGL